MTAPFAEEPSAPRYAAQPPLAERLPFATVFAYSQPIFALGMVGVLIHVYLAKFVTDVLLIGPALWGMIYAAVRVWDGFSDPMMGYLTDRTRSPWGRRRPWMAAAALPMAAAVVMLWSPPAMLEGAWLAIWMGLGILFYETLQTVFLIPHGALGVELSTNYHERTRLFGYTHIFSTTGTFIGIGVFQLLTDAEDPRALASSLSLVGALAVCLAFVYVAAKTKERREYQDLDRVSLAKGFRDLFRNPHARLLLMVTAIENLGLTCLLVLTPYLCQYVLQDSDFAIIMIMGYMVPQPFLTPIWIRMAKRIQKKALWLSAMVITCAGFATLFFISPQTSYLAYVIPPILGMAAGVGAVCEPAIKADVIDYDEYLSGERKEGSYSAIWSLVRKMASAVPPVLALSALDWSGYVPNQDQTEATLFVMNFFAALLPAMCFFVGALAFSKFSFNQNEHAEIRRLLELRRNAGSGPGIA